MFELNQYYTPENVAINAIELGLSQEPSVCVDSTCGSGNLLSAAETVFNEINCIGIDKDRSIIKTLKRKNPYWTLSSADMLEPRSYKRTVAYSYSSDCDLLLLNPPFSHQNRKCILVEYMETTHKCSVAMAYILHSFNAFRPQHGAIVVVPESVLYSDIDKAARNELSNKYTLKVLKELHCTTFKGTRARATVIRLDPELSHNSKSANNMKRERVTSVQIVRGGLPVYEMEEFPDGVPFVHTTSFPNLNYEIGKSSGYATELFSRGIIKGHFVLLPRVGLPRRSYLNPHFSSTNVQLSDCVIALSCSTKNGAATVANRLRECSDSLESLYRGTGARYVTVERLGIYLRSIGIDAK